MKAVRRVVRYRTDEGARVALLAAEGDKYLHLVMNDGAGVGAVRVPKTEGRYMTDVFYNGAPYPWARAVRRYRAIGRRLGITKAAKALLAP